MKRPCRIAAQIVIICMSLLISAFCATEMHGIWRNAFCNTGRPGFHITCFVLYMLWLPLPVVMFAAFRRRRLAALCLLVESLYLGVYFLFWDLVLPTHFIVGPCRLSIMMAVATLGVLASLYAIRISSPPARRVLLSPRLRLTIFTCIVIISTFMFHWFSAREEMRAASTCYVARCRAARGDLPGAIRAYDTLLTRYQHTTPTTHRVDSLIYRARFKYKLGDIEGVEEDREELRDLISRDMTLADQLKLWRDDPAAPGVF